TNRARPGKRTGQAVAGTQFGARAGCRSERKWQRAEPGCQISNRARRSPSAISMTSARTTIKIISSSIFRCLSTWTTTGSAGISGWPGSRALPSAPKTARKGGIVTVEVPGYIERDRIRALLDTARALLSEADEATNKPPPMAEAEYAVREWWSQQSR